MDLLERRCGTRIGRDSDLVSNHCFCFVLFSSFLSGAAQEQPLPPVIVCDFCHNSPGRNSVMTHADSDGTSQDEGSSTPASAQGTFRTARGVEDSLERQEQEQDLTRDGEEEALRTAKFVKKRVFRQLKFKLAKNDPKNAELTEKVLQHLGWKDAKCKKARSCWNNVQKTFIQQLRTKRGTVISAMKKEVIGE